MVLQQVLYERRMDEIMVDNIESFVLENLRIYFEKKNMLVECKTYITSYNQDHCKTTTIRFLNELLYISNIVRD
ncbi:MAG: hypothetical protein RI945_397, partial [Candidatus Parcubacteria bacterium]